MVHESVRQIAHQSNNYFTNWGVYVDRTYAWWEHNKKTEACCCQVLLCQSPSQRCLFPYRCYPPSISSKKDTQGCAGKLFLQRCCLPSPASAFRLSPTGWVWPQLCVNLCWYLLAVNAAASFNIGPIPSNLVPFHHWDSQKRENRAQVQKYQNGPLTWGKVNIRGIKITTPIPGNKCYQAP